MKKKVAILILSLFLMLEVFGCAREGKSDIPSFAGKEWIRISDWDEERLTLGDDFSWSYYEVGSGNPVDDADLFESYQYDSKKEQVILKGSGEKHIYQVVSYDDSNLVLEIDGEKREFSIFEGDSK